MFEFKILKKSKKSNARLGLLKTSHGVVETPCLAPVATQAAVKALTSEEVAKTNSQILICNTFHLHLRPGEKTVAGSGGLHKFMNWQKPLMTDSGGFQVFSLGFGKDYKIGKILVIDRSHSQSKKLAGQEVKQGQQPELLEITDKGVLFRSYLDGRQVFLGPKESIKIQEKLGADIIFAFDECPPPIANYEYSKESLKRTHNWAKICLRTKTDGAKNKQALFGIVQGGRFKDLRVESAKFIASLPFDGFGIGGEFGNNKRIMVNMLRWVIKELPQEKPRHLLGIGHLEDIEKVIKEGVDTFDCIVPTHNARHGMVFTSQGKIDIRKSQFLTDKNPLDKNCDCFICQNYKRNYISHLRRASELTAFSLLTFHNLYFFNGFVKKIRQKIKEGKF